MGNINIGGQFLKVRDCSTDERLKRINTCFMCGKKFYSARKSALYCSDACRQANYRNKHYI